MSVRPSRVDRISLLKPPSAKSDAEPSNISTNRTSTYGGSTSRSGPTSLRDTIHYISPATTPNITEYEGDLDYQQFVGFRPVETFPPETTYQSSGISTISCDEPLLQRTLAIIKPDAMKYQDVVLRAINEAGFRILNQRVIHLSPEQVSEIYEKHYGSPSFPHLVVSISISPVMVLSITGNNCVEKWKTMVGPYGLLREEWFFPYSVRTRFGILNDIPDVLHASDDVAEAKRENRYFYPKSILEPITIEEERVTDFVNQFVRAALLDGLIQVVRVKPIDPLLFLAEWLLLHNPYQPKFPEKIALSPL